LSGKSSAPIGRKGGEGRKLGLIVCTSKKGARNTEVHRAKGIKIRGTIIAQITGEEDKKRFITEGSFKKEVYWHKSKAGQKGDV